MPRDPPRHKERRLRFVAAHPSTMMLWKNGAPQDYRGAMDGPRALTKPLSLSRGTRRNHPATFSEDPLMQ
jgi:hypothetical protein